MNTRITARQHVTEFIGKHGYTILDRDIRISQRDGRASGIHFAAYDRERDCLVFVIVVASRSCEYKARMRTRIIKPAKVRMAVRNWRRVNRWEGDWRLDVAYVYGKDGDRPVIDHIENIKI